MKIIVGYIPTLEGEAAFTFAIAEALVHREELVIINYGKEIRRSMTISQQPKKLRPLKSVS